jgi:ATP-dependent protease HslVU (ClpYQ) peptidase subunit
MGEEIHVGATAVGIKVDEGVVLAAEKRVSYGFYTLSKAGKKVFIIDDRLAIASAGIIADMQTLAKILKLNARAYELDVKRKPTVRAIAKLLSVIMFSRRFMPFFAEVLVGGVDEEGAHLVVMDPLGSLIEDDYAALGTGAKSCHRHTRRRLPPRHAASRGQKARGTGHKGRHRERPRLRRRDRRSGCRQKRRKRGGDQVPANALKDDVVHLLRHIS